MTDFAASFRQTNNPLAAQADPSEILAQSQFACRLDPPAAPAHVYAIIPRHDSNDSPILLVSLTGNGASQRCYHTLPGGDLNPGEEPASGLQRLLAEQLQLSCAKVTPFGPPLCMTAAGGADQGRYAQVFLVEPEQGLGPRACWDKITGYGWICAADLDQLELFPDNEGGFRLTADRLKLIARAGLEQSALLRRSLPPEPVSADNAEPKDDAPSSQPKGMWASFLRWFMK